MVIRKGIAFDADTDRYKALSDRPPFGVGSLVEYVDGGVMEVVHLYYHYDAWVVDARVNGRPHKGIFAWALRLAKISAKRFKNPDFEVS